MFKYKASCRTDPPQGVERNLVSPKVGEPLGPQRLHVGVQEVGEDDLPLRPHLNQGET